MGIIDDRGLLFGSIDDLTFLVALVTAGLVQWAVQRDRRLFVTAAVLAANNLALHFYFVETGDQFDWLVNSGVDWVCAAYLILFGGGGRGVALLVLGYALALVCHLHYGFSSQDRAAQYHYWYQMSYTGWAQALLAALGGVDRGGGHRVSSALGQVLGRFPRVPGGLGARGLGAGRAALRTIVGPRA